MSYKRWAAGLVESMFDVRILRPDAVGLAFEEVHLGKLFKRFDIDCVFDVGANRGQYGRMIRQRAGYAGAIVSYEPGPDAARELKAAAAADARWTVVESALDEAGGRRLFHVMEDDQFSSLLTPSSRETDACADGNSVRRQFDVPVRTLSEEFRRLVAEIGFRAPFLKMDTQGHDMAVARGGGDVLGRFIGIQSEMAVKRLYDGAPDFIESIDFFRKAGFELSALVPNNTGHFPHLLEMDGIFIRKDLLA
jgi:FkbM family methyltransferase